MLLGDLILMLLSVALAADIGGEEVSNIYGGPGSSSHLTATNATGTSEGSAFGSGTSNCTAS